MKYEEAIKELEEIISKLNSASLPIEEAKTLFVRGKELMKFCFESVKEIKGKVYELKEEMGALLEEENSSLWELQNY